MTKEFKSDPDFCAKANAITPGNVYFIDDKTYFAIQKLIGGQLTSLCFTRKVDEGYHIKPATKRDKRFMLDLFSQTRLSFTEVEDI